MRVASTLQLLVWLLCSVPVGWLLWGAWHNQLGVNPAETLIRSTGDWAIRFLCLTLAVTPLRVHLRWAVLAPYRRVMGLMTYVYACLHLLCYAWLDQGLVPSDIVRDIVQRPFITVGFIAFLLLTPLALTSYPAAMRSLGGRRWQQLHRLIYGVAVLAVLHFFWMRAGKNDFAEVALYAAILGSLLGWRLWRHRQQRLAA
jgi:methionine sulfoxide reductase heme-binding subunit